MTEVFFHPDYTTFWTAFAAVAQALAAMLGAAALIYSIFAFRKSLNTLHYAELDRMYFDLLRIGIEKPHLRCPAATRTTEQELEYENYAFIVWNFLETIHDRCLTDHGLRDTWYPAMDTENRIHRVWFDRPENHPKFKEAFRDFILAGRFRELR